MNQALADIIPVIQQAKNVLIATHVFPDVDAMGSLLAMGNILCSMGKKVYLYSEEPANHILEFLPGAEKLNIGLPGLEQFDCCLALDCGDELRLGRVKDNLLNIHPFVVVDHHAGHKKFGDFRWVDPGKSSTGEMVYELALELGVKIDYATAYCLYSAIVADTGSFKYASTSPRTLHIAGELLTRGVNPAEISGKIFDNFTKNRLHLLQEVLATLKLYEDEQLAVITVNKDQFDKTGTTPVDTELFINYPRSLATVKIAAFIKESKDFVGVSLRSKGNYDVTSVAGKFGGGGHRNAAGFKLQGKTIDDVRKVLLPELKLLLNASSN